MAIISDYFRINPTVPKTELCGPLQGSDSSIPWMIGECRNDVESMTRIDAYFRKHPKAKRPESCSLPLRSGFLGECLVQIEAAEAPAPPPAEWHRIIKDTVGYYRIGVYSDGNYVGATEGYTEIHAGKVFKLQSIPTGKGAFVSPLSGKTVSTSNGYMSLTLPTNAFDPKIIHCNAKTVLLHQEVTCND